MGSSAVDPGLVGPARARVAPIVGGHRHTIGGDARDIGVTRIQQRRQGGVHIGHRALNGQVIAAIGPGTDRGCSRERHIQHPVGDLQAGGDEPCRRIHVGHTQPGNGRLRLFIDRLGARHRVDRRIVDRRDVNLDIVDVLLGPARARVAPIVGASETPYSTALEI